MLKHLANASIVEQRRFIDSFDEVHFDIDGVIWLLYNPIQGASDCISNLKKLGKNVRYVTNGNLVTEEKLVGILAERNFKAEVFDIVIPMQTMVSYLKKIDIKNKIYVIGMKPLKEKLINLGYELIPDPPQIIEENLTAILKNYNEDNVEAVILDIDFNFNYIKLQKAVWYLKNPKCKLIVIASDKGATTEDPKSPIVGTCWFFDAIKLLSDRKHVLMGKPSLVCANYLKEKYKIMDPSRVLFVGDSIESDMGVGATGGFQKLLVLSGTEKIESVKNWSYPEDHKPEYYIEDLKCLNDVLKSVFDEL